MKRPLMVAFLSNMRAVFAFKDKGDPETSSGDDKHKFRRMEKNKSTEIETIKFDTGHLKQKIKTKVKSRDENSKLKVIDLFGNETPLISSNGTIDLVVKNIPIYLETNNDLVIKTLEKTRR
ncbi:MAG: hypothetical protein QXP04_03345 [Candidatus Nanoarchaeia archaeon]|nr:hypothetical protein [Candidatus Jingweiarchaeum tengchongense]